MAVCFLFHLGFVPLRWLVLFGACRGSDRPLCSFLMLPGHVFSSRGPAFCSWVLIAPLCTFLLVQAAAGGGSVPVTQLTVEQLGHVRQTTEREIEMLMTKISELNVAHQKLTASRECATFMGESSAPQPVLVPLTTSIYVPGVIQNPSELMVDVGTGYFISVRYGRLLVWPCCRTLSLPLVGLAGLCSRVLGTGASGRLGLWRLVTQRGG